MQYGYPQPLQPPDATKILSDYMANITRQITGQSAQGQAPAQAQPAAQVPTYHCQPIKNLQEIDEMRWFNPTPFVGLTEDGQYIGVRRWDGAIPAATTEYFKRISPEELPQPPRSVTHEELVTLLPEILSQYIPTLLKQMGVTANDQSAFTAASTVLDGQLPAIAGRKPKGAVGAKSGEAGGDI